MTDYALISDERLAKLAQDDHAAFDALYRRHVTAVYRYCAARTPSRTDAEDATAQTFLAALEGLENYGARGSFAGWLFGIARHKCTDVYRSNRHYTETPVENVVGSRAGACTSPEAAANSALLMDCVERMIGQLSPNRQEALRLRYWGGLSLRDVARAMDRSVAAVKMLVSRGIADLRKRCGDE